MKNNMGNEKIFQSALKECSKTARQAYKNNLTYLNEVEKILKGLSISLGKNLSILLQDFDSKNFEFLDVLNKLKEDIKRSSSAGLEELKSSLDTKRKYLNDFTITLFGRTKAGKSTIRESLSGNGDGSTIGLGSLHTTKEVGDYYWKGLRILDSPGVEGFNGESEKQKAYEIIDQSDIIIFLTTDDSQQPGEFAEMGSLIEINKPFFVILNIKDKLTNPSYLKRFLLKKGNLFNTDIINEHRKRINFEVKKMGINNLRIVWLSALAGCISQFATRALESKDPEKFSKSIQHPQIKEIIRWIASNLTFSQIKQLWFLSQFETAYSFIQDEVNLRGKQRRILTFYDSTINYVDTINKMLWEHQRSIRKQAQFMVNKRKEIKSYFENFITESNTRIEEESRHLFSKIKEWIPNFIEDNFGKNNTQSILNNKLEDEKTSIEKRMKELLDEIISQFKKDLSEFTRQYQYDVNSLKLDPSELGDMRKGQWGKIMEWSAIGTGAVGSIVVAIAFPVGLILIGIGLVLALLGPRFRKKEENKWHNEKTKAKDRLWNSIDKMERKTRGYYKTWFYENISIKGRKSIVSQVGLYIESLFNISDNTKKYTEELINLKNDLNKKLFFLLLKLEGINCKYDDIKMVAREQGISIKIMLSPSVKLNNFVNHNLSKLCGEFISIFAENINIKENIKNSLYPPLELADISISQSNGSQIAKVIVKNDRDKALCIGRHGVNVRLAQTICNIKIEII